jgi:hypothetical protein
MICRSIGTPDSEPARNPDRRDSRERWRRAVQTMPLTMERFGLHCTTAFSDSAAKFWSTTSACRRDPDAPANAKERLRTDILIKWPDSLDPILRSQAKAQLRQLSPADFGTCFHRWGHQILRANRSRLNYPALGLSVGLPAKAGVQPNRGAAHSPLLPARLARRRCSPYIGNMIAPPGPK